MRYCYMLKDIIIYLTYCHMLRLLLYAKGYYYILKTIAPYNVMIVTQFYFCTLSNTGSIWISFVFSSIP